MQFKLSRRNFLGAVVAAGVSIVTGGTVNSVATCTSLDGLTGDARRAKLLEILRNSKEVTRDWTRNRGVYLERVRQLVLSLSKLPMRQQNAI